MLLDQQNIFSDAQEIKSTVVSDNVIKMTPEGRLKEVSYGTPKPLLIQVVEKFEGVTSLKVAIETSETKDFSEKVTLIETAPTSGAQLVSGYRFPILQVPAGNRGYMRLNYIVEGSATAGKITSGIIVAHDNSYQDM